MAKKFPTYATAICSGCKMPKPLAEFKKKHHKAVRGKDVRDTLCKTCRKRATSQEIQRKYR